MAKGVYLSLKCSPAPEERRECGEDGQKGSRHREFSLTHRAGKFNDYAADGIFERHRAARPGCWGLEDCSDPASELPVLADWNQMGEILKK